MTLAISGHVISTIIIILLVFKINYHVNKGQGNISDEWDILEIIIALVFGWIGVLYILITYTKYVFMSPFSHGEKEDKKESHKDNKSEDKKPKFTGVK